MANNKKVAVSGAIYVLPITANVDSKYGPYQSVEEAWELLGPDEDDVACIGLTVGIQEDPDGPIVEYWFKDACESADDLVPKGGDLPSGTVIDPDYVHTDNNYTDGEKTKLEGLENYDDTEILAALDDKVDKESGKVLSSNDFTTSEKTKLASVEENAQENIIEEVKVNNTALTPDANKSINISIPEVLEDLDNINVTSATDGQVLAYDATNEEWVNETIVVDKALDDLTDVTITSASDRQTLIYDDTNDEWVNGTLNTSDLTNDSGFIDNTVDDLVNYYDKTEIDSKVASVYKYKGSVQTYADLPSTGQVVGDVYNIATADSTHHIKAGDNVAWTGTAWDVLAGDIDLSSYYTSSEVDSLLDEKISEPLSDGTNGQVLTTDGNGGRSWTSIPAGVESLDDLSDVGITTPTEGQILKYDATNDEWINANPDTISLDLEDLNNVSTTTPTDGQMLTYDATNDEWVNTDLDISVSDLGDLGDVDIDSTSIADGQIIKYNATTGKWENANVDVSTSNLEDLGNVNVTTPTEGDIITYDATNSEWVNVPNTNVGQIIQVEELPTAGENELGNIYQYVGTTTSDYVNGYFYKCLSTGTGIYTRYYWLNIAVNTETITDVDEVPKKATYYNNIEPIKNTIYRTPSDVSRKVIFSENRSYLNLLDLGFVYDSSQDVYTTTEEIYFRKLGTEDQFSIFVEDVGEYKLCDYFSYRYNNRCHHTIKYKGTTLVDKDELGTFTVYEFIKACELYIGDRKGQIVNKLTNLSPTSVLSTQCEILPIPKANIEGLVIQYIGETDENYTNGYFYKCVSDGEDPATYSWENIQVQEGGSGSETLSGLDDVNITNPTNDQILKYDAVNEEWVNGTGGGGASSLVDLTDTSIKLSKNKQVLLYNSKKDKWINKTPNASNVIYNNLIGTWLEKTWSGLTNFNGEDIWSDGENVYYSLYNQHYILNKETSTWLEKTWSGSIYFSSANHIWTDGENIYFSDSYEGEQFVLNKETSTWLEKTWLGFDGNYTLDGKNIWTDGENTYFSDAHEGEQRVLNKETSTWLEKTWSGLTNFNGEDIWSDGENVYYSAGSNQYVLDESTSTWSTKTWTGLTNFDGEYIWSDGENIYYNNSHILDEETSTWLEKTWSGLTNFTGTNIWTDGENIYYNHSSNSCILSEPYESVKKAINEVVTDLADKINEPATEGTNGQVLTTDGNGGRSWTTVQGSGSQTLAGLNDVDINCVEWSTKTWSGLTNFRGGYIWSDGVNVYYSRNENQYVLDKSTSTWSPKTWSGLTNFNGEYIWSDDENIYYSSETQHYVLNKLTSTWSTKTWTGLTEFWGSTIWSDGDNIYCSAGSNQYILDKSTSTWSPKTWLGLSQTDLSNFRAEHIWSDGNNFYYSYLYGDAKCQYVLDKSTSTWSPKTWSGLVDFDGIYIWSDGANIYFSSGTTEQYVLDKSTSTWLPKTWTGRDASEFYGQNVWTDGNNIYSSRDTVHYKLNHNEEALIYDWDNQKWINKEIVSKEDIPKTFTGTQAEWDALTTSEKLTYEQVNITDDESDPSVVVDAVTDGDMHAVTSNAVADKFSSLGQKYVSADVNVSETSWTSKTFTFNTNIPKGKYLIGAKFAISDGTQSAHCVIAGLTYVSFVSGYGSNMSTTTSEIYTQDTDSTVSISYNCAITVNNPVTINLVLIRIG